MLLLTEYHNPQPVVERGGQSSPVLALTPVWPLVMQFTTRTKESQWSVVTGFQAIRLSQHASRGELIGERFFRVRGQRKCHMLGRLSHGHRPSWMTAEPAHHLLRDEGYQFPLDEVWFDSGSGSASVCVRVCVYGCGGWWMPEHCYFLTELCHHRHFFLPLLFFLCISFLTPLPPLHSLHTCTYCSGDRKKKRMQRQSDKKEGRQRQTGSGDSDREREREGTDSWDSSKGESIDPGEWADSHFTASAVTPQLGYGTEPYIPSGQGDLDPICFCLCGKGWI